MTLFLYTDCNPFLTMASQNGSFSAFISQHYILRLFYFAFDVATLAMVWATLAIIIILYYQMSCLSWHIIIQIGYTTSCKVYGH